MKFWLPWVEAPTQNFTDKEDAKGNPLGSQACAMGAAQPRSPQPGRGSFLLHPTTARRRMEPEMCSLYAHVGQHTDTTFPTPPEPRRGAPTSCAPTASPLGTQHLAWDSTTQPSAGHCLATDWWVNTHSHYCYSSYPLTLARYSQSESL